MVSIEVPPSFVDMDPLAVMLLTGGSVLLVLLCTMSVWVVYWCVAVPNSALQLNSVVGTTVAQQCRLGKKAPHSHSQTLGEFTMMSQPIRLI